VSGYSGRALTRCCPKLFLRGLLPGSKVERPTPSGFIQSLTNVRVTALQVSRQVTSQRGSLEFGDFLGGSSITICGSRVVMS
jgi:hypothetical protein